MKRKVVSVLLAAAMILSMTACGGDDKTDSTGIASTEETSAEGGEEGTYTYTYFLSCPNTWSPTDWVNSDEVEVLTYTVTPLYEFHMNENKDGHVIDPAAAASMPEDVTAEYVGNETYGVPADATEGYAWKVELNPDLCWEDGTPITADDYEYSLQQYLNPEMSNYRASYFYTGSMGLANAQKYYNSAHAGEIGYVQTLADLGFSSVEEAEAAGYTDFGVDLDGFWGIAEAGIVSIADETEYRDEAVDEGEAEANVSGKYIYDNYLAPGMSYESYVTDYVYVGETLEGAEWEEVGFVKNDDYSVTFIFANPNTEFDFEYGISSLMLVKEDLYEANKQQTGDIVKCSYGTAVDKFMSYGPYKIASFQEDKEMRLTRNDAWYGYSDGSHEGLYQTTDIVQSYVTEKTTQLSLFLQGKASQYALTSEDMDSYGSSDYVHYMPETFAYHYSFNTDLDALKAEETPGENHSIIAYKDFRHAVSLAVDRSEYVSSITSSSEVGFGLLSYVYVCDPDTGELYRDSEYAKQALCDAYGASDESEITGYDKEAAAALFQSAYEQCLADGNISETDVVSIDFHTYGSENYYVKLVDFLQNAISEATVGTDLEGKVTVNMVEDMDYYNNMLSGLVDVTLASWGGSDMDPYSIMECYCSDSLLQEYGFDPYTVTAAIEVNGEEITKTLNEWYVALCQGEYKIADTDTKNQILAGMERALIEEYAVVPLYYLTSSALYEQRIMLGSDEYVNSLLGFGGIEYITYTMDDAEWAAYCAENNNQLTY